MLDWLEWAVREAHLAHLALGVLVLEAALALALRARLGARLPGVLLNIATGAALMLIVRAALLDRPAWEIAALFSLAFPLHLADMALRLRR